MLPEPVPAHYIVFHPERARYQARVRATALINGQRVAPWVGRVWVDKPPGNEDPFVFGSSWAYSYCHATQLRREPRESGYVTKGSCILFCSGNLADKKQVLAIDTVFWVAAAHKWRAPSKPPDYYAQEVSGRHTDLWKSHLRFGGQPGGHKGQYTYEAALFPQPDSRYSRLPLDADGDRIRISLSLLSRELREQISENLHGKYPALLSDENLRELLALERERTSIEVVRDIVAEEHDFIALREELIAGCAPCQKEC